MLYFNQVFFIKSVIYKYLDKTMYKYYKHWNMKKLRPEKLNNILKYRSCTRSNFIKSIDNHCVFNCCYLSLSRYPMHLDIINTYGFGFNYVFDGMFITFPLKNVINSSYCFWNDRDPEYIDLTTINKAYKELNLIEGYSFYIEKNNEALNKSNEFDFLVSMSNKMTEIFSKYNAYTAILAEKQCYVLLRDTDIYRCDKSQLLEFLEGIKDIAVYLNNGYDS